ncbi:MAG: efflux RND transporter periplasmic adaptor subunit [Candidatus Saccharicenans sp.]
MRKKLNKKQKISGLVVLGLLLLIIIFFLRRSSSDSASAEEQINPEVAVEVGQIIKTTLHRYVNAYGLVEPEPAAEGRRPAVAFIASPVGGLLTEILAKEGQLVEEGQVIFKLDSRLAEIAIARARKELEFARQNYERQKKLLATQSTSEKNYKEAENLLQAAEENLAAALTELSYLQIKSPLKGLLTKVNVQLGQTVEPSSTLAEVIDLNRLVISARVPSSESHYLQVGQTVDLTPASNITGNIIYIGKDIDPQTDTILIRASLPANSGLLPGNFLSLKIICEEHRDCLAVPIDSLVRQPGQEAISIVEGNIARRIPVTSGLRDRGLVEVKGEGLKEGMTVVTVGAYALPDVTKIKIIKK